MSLCVACRMLWSLFWLLLCRDSLVHVHNLLGSKRLWSQQGSSCLLFPPFSLLNFRLLCFFLYQRDTRFLSFFPPRSPLFLTMSLDMGSPNLLRIKSRQQELPVGYKVCARSSVQVWAAPGLQRAECQVLSKATVRHRRDAWGPWTAQTLWGPISSECWFVPVILFVSQSNVQRKFLFVSQSNVQRKFPHYLVESLNDEDDWSILRRFGSQHTDLVLTSLEQGLRKRELTAGWAAPLNIKLSSN